MGIRECYNKDIAQNNDQGNFARRRRWKNINKRQRLMSNSVEEEVMNERKRESRMFETKSGSRSIRETGRDETRRGEPRG